MIAAVWILLALAAAGGGTAVWKHQKEGATGASTPLVPSAASSRTELSPAGAAPAEKRVETCQKQPLFCTQEYLPKSCTVRIGGTDVSASGNNGCQAVSALRVALCAAGHPTVTESSWNAVSCTRTD